MIGGDGINDESNKTAPAPTRNTDLTKKHTKEACECSYDLSQMAKPLDQIDERLFLLFHAV